MNIPLAFFNATGTTLSVFFIDGLGRRYIILRSTPLIALCWIITAVGISFTGAGQSDSAKATGGTIAAIGVCFLLLFFSFGMSSTPWAINSEIFPLHVIGTAIALAATTNWVANAFVAQVFKIVTEISVASQVIVYVCLACFTVGTFFFTYYLIPETA